MFVKQEEAKQTLSKRLKKRLYQFIKESAINEELKKNNVELQEFEDVDPPNVRNSTN